MIFLSTAVPGKAKVRREWVKETLEVYPIANYGAIEIGLHKFYYMQPGKAEQLDGTFRFVHIWIHKAMNGKYPG